MLRILHELSGVRVEPQKLLLDRGGSLIGRFDLWIRGTNRYPEYDGEHHREAHRHHKDLGREKAVRRIGAERYGYTDHEIRSDAMSVLGDADRTLGRPHDPTRLK